MFHASNGAVARVRTARIRAARRPFAIARVKTPCIRTT
jgi:hypothetical protein